MVGKRRWLSILLVVALATLGISASAGADSGSESGFLSKINAERSSRGLNTLAVDGGLRSHARVHTAEMIANNDLYHSSSAELQAAAGSGWSAIAENVGRGGTVDSLHSAFMNSSGHKANILGDYNYVGIGTDTGCSVRLPAAACDIVGLKTRLGAVPVDGVYPLCPSFDTVGPMARSVEDVAALWSVLCGRARPEPLLRGLTVGLLRTPPSLADGREVETSDAVDEWAGRFEELGARVVEAAIPPPPASPLSSSARSSSRRRRCPRCSPTCRSG